MEVPAERRPARGTRSREVTLEDMEDMEVDEGHAGDYCVKVLIDEEPYVGLKMVSPAYQNSDRRGRA